MRYILDTNIWVELAGKRLTCNDVRNAGVQIALAPLVIIELVNGVIRGGEARFADNKAMIACMAQGQPEILELPKIFVNKLIWNLPFGRACPLGFPSGPNDVALSAWGLRPDPDWFSAKFSAGIEFLIASIVQVRNGANPQKNNRGLYVDSQFFWYLGDPELTIVTMENFSSEINASPPSQSDYRAG